MYKIIGLLALIMAANGFFKAQYEFGVDQSVHWAEVPYHVLQAGSAVPRNYEVTIKFQKKFQLAPVVTYAPIRLDWSDGIPQGFDIQIGNINTVGFTLKFVALSDKLINGFDIFWSAIQDSNISGYEFFSNKLAKINTGSGTRYEDIQFDFPESWSFAKPPNGALFMTGFQITKPWPSFAIYIDSITTKSFIIRARAKAGAIIEFFRFKAIFGLPNTLYTGKFSVKSVEDAFKAVAPPSERILILSEDITDANFHTGLRLPFYGINGFYYNHGAFMRFTTKNFDLQKTKINVDMGTWYNSQLLELYADYFIYKPKEPENPEDPVCAVIYEECDYKGDSFTLCDRKMSLPKDGWKKPIKSFKVPVDKVVKVYNEEDLKGLSIRIDKDLPCMEIPKFSLIELVHSNTNSEFWENE